MPRAARFFIFLSLSIASLIAGAALLLGQMQRYNATLGIFPPGTTIAGIPVGGLNEAAARERLLLAYASTPVELHINDSIIHIDPAAAGQQLDLEAMLGPARQASTARPYWPGLWDFLFNRVPATVESGLACTVSVDALHAYLYDQIAPRYDRPPIPAGPAAPGDVLFRKGSPGVVLDLETAEPSIRAALCDQKRPVVTVGSRSVESEPASIEDLDALLRTLAYAPGFNGLVEVYFQDIASGQEINFAYNAGLPVEPVIAFTAASTIKIPVMISAFKRIDGEMPAGLRQQMELMIDLSDNSSTDDVMQTVLDPNIAPVQVTEDLRALGFENTFLAGLFYPGAPLLNRYETPANRRTDITTDPDIYNQTTAADMGRLLAAIQRCTAGEENPLAAAFAGQVSQAECMQMIDLLAKNRKGVLLETGLPEGVRMAHKYGWVTDPVDGLMHTASDAAVVYTPGGNFVLTVYFYDPAQLPWDPAQVLSSRLVATAYNFYNTR